MTLDYPMLIGKHVRLEPLELRHAEALVAASAGGASLYKWSTVPQSAEAVRAYIETALAGREAGTLAFATVRLSDGKVVGSTRFFDMDPLLFLVVSKAASQLLLRGNNESAREWLNDPHVLI